LSKKEKAYLIYPFAIYGEDIVEDFKEMLKLEGYEIVDPFDLVGIGTDAEIAERDLKLIEESGVVIAYLPCEGVQSGFEIYHAFMKGKKIKIYLSPNLDGPFFAWLRERGVEIRYWAIMELR